MNLAAGLLLDLRGVKQSGDDRCRADAYGDSRLHELAAAFLAGAVGLVVTVVHAEFSMAVEAGWKAA